MYKYLLGIDARFVIVSYTLLLTFLRFESYVQINSGNNCGVFMDVWLRSRTSFKNMFAMFGLLAMTWCIAVVLFVFTPQIQSLPILLGWSSDLIVTVTQLIKHATCRSNCCCSCVRNSTGDAIPNTHARG